MGSSAASSVKGVQATNTGKSKVLNITFCLWFSSLILSFFISMFISILIDHYSVFPLGQIHVDPLTPSHTTWGKENCYCSSAARFCLGFLIACMWKLKGHPYCPYVCIPLYAQMSPCIFGHPICPNALPPCSETLQAPTPSETPDPSETLCELSVHQTDRQLIPLLSPLR